MSGPHGIGLDKDENILIAAKGKSRILRYSPTGKFMDRIDSGSGSLPGEVNEPREVTNDMEGRIFVTDSKGDRPRVQVWSHEGEFQHIFAEKGRWQGMLQKFLSLKIVFTKGSLPVALRLLKESNKLILMS